MSGLLGQRKNNNDMAEDLMKKYNIREISELSEVDETLSTSDNKEIIIDNKLGDVSDKKKSPQDVMWSILSEWSKDGKIDIPSKKEESQPQEEVLEPELTEQEPVTQAPIVVPEAREQKPEERTEPKTTMPEDIEEQEQEIVQEEQINNEVPANMRNRLNSVRLTFESGRPEYEILYNDENGELQFEIISDVEPRSMTDKEKQVYKQSIEPKHKRDLLGVDVGIIVALHELDEKNGGTSQLGHQYLYYLKDLISNNKERGENDIDIIYDLSNIKKSNLSLGERLSISRIAAKSERLGTAEYIPAPNKIRDFFRNFRQKKLPSGNFEKVGHYAIDDFANYEGFDMDTFIEQQESVQGRRLTQEEKDRLMDTYYDAKERNAWKEELKVDTEPLPQQEQTQNNEPQEKEEETR